ncbi:MAG: hypothetical protein RBU30_15265 [Polyangia bacterium]|jgi:hypothetical protein|nr:hypothetical protein [Polyangia bacterium]
MVTPAPGGKVTAHPRWAGLLLALAVLLTSAPAAAAPPWNTRDELICRAASAVGFSYYWGNSCWCASGCTRNTACGAGSCSGSCPSCTHYGTYGADCSGLVNKVWQVPNPIATTTCGHGPYVANSYKYDHTYWDVISRSSLQRGDVLASSTHIVVYHYGDPWGSMVVYEAKGCSYGIVHNWRTCSSLYSAARRINISSGCVCTPGQTQSQACGNCGSQSRTCLSSCQWGAWSACAGQGVCSPGASQSQTCGNCGTQTRSCSSSCSWGAWSTCAGQGVCSPGAAEERDCCDCGSQRRSCSTSCQWGAWSVCDGPDPPGDAQQCNTGEAGICAEGRLRCVQGCLTCARLLEPTAELCNDLDDDCDGEVDDGPPQVMGEPPPPYAARLLDHSVPRRLVPGESARAWAVFENVGAETWPPGGIWLGAAAPGDGAPSQLWDSDTWPAHDVLAVLHEEVPPGSMAELSFDLTASTELDREVTETFVLLSPSGRPLTCPDPYIGVTIGPVQRSPSGEAPTPPGAGQPGASQPVDPSVPWVSGGCACGSSGNAPHLLLLLPLLIVLGLRRRDRSRNQPSKAT